MKTEKDNQPKEEKDETVKVVTTTSQDPEEDKPRRTMLRFEREGFVIPVWGVMSIDKDMDMEQSATGRLSPVYLIILNRGMEIGMPQCPVGERKITYYDPDVRDKAYERILGILETSGVQFIQLS